MDNRFNAVETAVTFEKNALRTLMESVPDLIFFKDLESRFVLFSRSTAEHARLSMLNAHRAAHPQTWRESIPKHLATTETCASHLVGKTDRDVFSDERARLSEADEQGILRTGQPILNRLKQTTEPNGEVYWRVTTKLPWKDDVGRIIGIFGISRDITAQKLAEIQVEIIRRQLIDNARMVGQSEVAARVIHNLGNILNSVKVSCALSIGKAKGLSTASLAKLADLIEPNLENLAEFFSTDPQGRKVTGYLMQIARILPQQQASLLEELMSLRTNIDYIEGFISSQQAYAASVRGSVHN